MFNSAGKSDLDSKTYDAKKDYIQTLDMLKKNKKKKKLINYINTDIVKSDMKKVKVSGVNLLDGQQCTMPHEIAAKIMAYAGTNFGSKINGS